MYNSYERLVLLAKDKGDRQDITMIYFQEQMILYIWVILTRREVKMAGY